MSSKLAVSSLLAVTLLFASLGRGAEQDYAARFEELRKEKADAQIEPLLNEWREKRPNDPEAWITSANYYFNQRQVMISTKKPQKGDFSLTDKKTGKVTGSIAFEQDKGNMKRAADLLQQATMKFPDRLDIWCGLAFIYQENGDFESEMSTLQRMVAYAHEHAAQLKWLNGELLKEPAEKFVLEKLHGYGLYYEKKENADDDRRWFQISTLAVKQYPTNATAWNDVAGYYADIGEWQKARESLEKAHQIEPKSTGVLINLGNISLQLEDVSGARRFFEEALKLEPNGQYAQEAKQALRQLKKK